MLLLFSVARQVILEEVMKETEGELSADEQDDDDDGDDQLGGIDIRTDGEWSYH